ncbi:uncharacterized protein C05D11.13-like [Rhagoletis pomonella]|uniref:uncharacterized protein C05D11.13-like n=1 Tax=Rhagoletis pomonella TaxID=28610 RepID=UPI0017863747|nr:uncharacterized protein C05D11.13-like [Rhagoletis pomonella]
MTASETPEEYEARLTKQRERYTQMIASETPEEYEVRLIQSRERQRQQLGSETPEHRDTRLNKQRERTQQCRANNLQAFENAINTICIHVCDICTKRCYPNQVRTVRYNAAALTYMWS